MAAPWWAAFFLDQQSWLAVDLLGRIAIGDW
jgi:hypothetical protein